MRYVARAHGALGRVADDDADDLLIGSLLLEQERWSSLARTADLDTIVEYRAVLDAIAALSDRQRAAVYLQRIQGMSHPEIGELLGIAAATVAVHAHRGVRSVREALVTSSTATMPLPTSSSVATRTRVSQRRNGFGVRAGRAFPAPGRPPPPARPRSWPSSLGNSGEPGSDRGIVRPSSATSRLRGSLLLRGSGVPAGQHVGAVLVEVVPVAVVAHGGARVGVPGEGLGAA
jgi:hypothetical protein